MHLPRLGAVLLPAIFFGLIVFLRCHLSDENVVHRRNLFLDNRQPPQGVPNDLVVGRIFVPHRGIFRPDTTDQIIALEALKGFINILLEFP